MQIVFYVEIKNRKWANIFFFAGISAFIESGYVLGLGLRRLPGDRAPPPFPPREHREYES
jgi:hypothetical protein